MKWQVAMSRCTSNTRVHDQRPESCAHLARLCQNKSCQLDGVVAPTQASTQQLSCDTNLQGCCNFLVYGSQTPCLLLARHQSG